MPNVWTNPDMVAAKSLDFFENYLVAAKLVDRQWESQFGKVGAKIGDTCRLRLANNFTVRVGNAFSAQNIEEATRTLVIDTPLGVDFIVDRADASLTWDRAEERYLRPAMRRLANEVDRLLLRMYREVPNFVGTYNTAPSVLGDFLAAKTRLDLFGVPPDDRYFILDPATHANAITSMQGLFNQQKELGSQYMTGNMDFALGAYWKMDQNINAHTAGTQGGTPLVNLGGQTGATIDLDGWTASITNVLRRGDILTFTSVNAVNPITGEDLGVLRQFVVTANVSSTGAGVTADVPIYPSIVTSGPRRTCTVSPADNATVTVFGAADVVAQQPLYTHKGAFALVIAPQAMPMGTHSASMKSDPDANLGISYVCDYDIDTNQFKHRFDILVGMLAQIPEYACRIGTA